MTDGSHAHSRAFVVREHEEGGSEGVHPAVVGEAIGDGTHGVFAHTEVNVAPQPGLAVEITLASKRGQRGAREVSIAPQEPRHLAGDGGQDLAARLARG